MSFEIAQFCKRFRYQGFIVEDHIKRGCMHKIQAVTFYF